MTTLRNILPSAAAVLLLVSAAAGQTASPVACGAILTTNLTLAANLSCPGLKADAAALTVAADGVTVDLNGFTISGTGGGYGIVVAGADNVTVRNGEVRAFALGLVATSAGPNRVYSLSIRDARMIGNSFAGIYLDGVRFSEVRDSEISENLSDGILVWNDSSFNTVAGNTLVRNARSGISVGCDPYSFAKNPGDPSNCDGKRAYENMVEDNTLFRNGYAFPGVGQSGIDLVFADRNTVRGNLVVGSHLAAPREQDYSRGIIVAAGTDNQILYNHVLDSGGGIVIAYHGSPKAYALNTVVTGNTALHCAAGGIMVSGAEASGAVITDNFTAANGVHEKTGFAYQCRSGICVQGEAAVLMNNLATDHPEYGILVESKSPIASGNRAMRNGKEQCSGVECQ